MEPEQERTRLDRFLTRAGTGLSRASVQKAITAGAALVNGRPAKSSRLLCAGDEVVFEPPAPVQMEALPEALPLAIVHEDRDLLVIDKQRGLVVHPAAGNRRGTLVNAVLAHCPDLSGIGGSLRPGIVHRLDKDTTGLMVVAKNDAAHLALAEQLRSRTMSRTYLALVHGLMPAAAGRFLLPIGRDPKNRKRMAVSAKGKPALTDYRVLEALGGYSLLELTLGTGRTHQIRVHLAACGHPVVGDRTYGPRRETLGLEGQALHAARLSFIHPRDGRPMHFHRPPPADFLAALDRARALAGRGDEDRPRA